MKKHNPAPKYRAAVAASEKTANKLIEAKVSQGEFRANQVMTGLHESTMESRVRAHKAGATYWALNKPYDSNSESLAQVARSCGWHGDDMEAWLAGYWQAMSRERAYDPDVQFD
jgi:hypothetical protein